ncbi:flagellar motor switch protein FliM [Enterobacter sp. BIGb0383]|uniref:flagellar motor switch protein FliM n=1 Tax=unclassified Enterobacter TaxID=2608935 RepID=UPI000F4A0095|nr:MULTISPECIES: flagellar motor switch protein FliM [unclassified Enterobacter]ROP58335.1 flagellar motor switch protein FliM [Enterobacter sp. BIGb0383]ROS06777.1 flagellar motor switch protein FliM [Enterobacter sp. BIGb0359]
MSDSLLSQAEIDRLLNGGSSTESESVQEPEGTDDIRPYDPRTQRRVIRDRMQSLEIINERFARQFRMDLFNLLRRNPDVTVGNMKIEPYHEFARNLPVPTNLNLVHMNPLRGTALFAFSPHMVSMAVDNLFGGDGRFPTKVDGREFTPTEQRIIRRIMSMAQSSYDEAWSSIFKLKTQYVRSETQIKFTNITSSPNDIVITTPFTVEIGSHVGELSICIPFSIIEPLRELLTNPPRENSKQEDEQWHSTMAVQIRDTELELIARLADIPTHVSRIMTLQKGDVIPLDKPEKVEVFADGHPIFSGKYGRLNKQLAIKVEKILASSLLSLNKEK